MLSSPSAQFLEYESLSAVLKLRNTLFDVGKYCALTCSVSHSAELSLAAFSENSALHESTERLHARRAYSVAHLRNCVTIGMPETSTAKKTFLKASHSFS